MSNGFFAASSTAASHFFKALPWAAGTALVIGKVFPTNRVHTISQMARAAFGGALLAAAFMSAAGRLSIRGLTTFSPFYERGLIAASTLFVAKLLPKRAPLPVSAEIVAASKQLQDAGVWVVRPEKVSDALRFSKNIAVLNIDCNHIALYRYRHQPEHGHPYDVDWLYVEKQGDGSYLIGYQDWKNEGKKVLFPIAEAKTALEVHFGVRILDDALQMKLDEENEKKAKAFVAAHPNWEKEQEQKLGIKIVKRAPVKTFQMVKDEYNLKEEKLTYPRLAKIAAFIFGP